jgi:hypothetical protein
MLCILRVLICGTDVTIPYVMPRLRQYVGAPSLTQADTYPQWAGHNVRIITTFDISDFLQFLYMTSINNCLLCRDCVLLRSPHTVVLPHHSTLHNECRWYNVVNINIHYCVREYFPDHYMIVATFIFTLRACWLALKIKFGDCVPRQITVY